MLAEYAASEGLDLGESIAYADSASDLPSWNASVSRRGQPRSEVGRHRAPQGLAYRALGARSPEARSSLVPMGPLDNGLSRWWDRFDVARRVQ